MAEDCQLCPLHKTAITVCVGGRGPEQAEVLVVGQNPGAQEDLAGEPFIGPTGKLLASMLRDAGYDPDQVRLTNAVRCRTPKNSPPGTENIDACRTYLVQEILRVQPKAIIALGDTALRALLKTAGLKERRGKSWPLHPSFGYECEVWPTYHPAFLLRVPQVKGTVLADLRRVRDRTKEQSQIPWARFPWTGSMSPLGVPLALDIETIDEHSKITEQPTQLALYDGEGLASVCDPALFKPINGEDCIQGDPLVTHNGWDFDLPKLRAAGLSIKRWGRDTMVMGYLDDETQPLGLEALCVKYLGVRGWKEDRDAPLGSEKLAEYNARDAINTWLLYHKLLEILGPRIRIADEIILPGVVALDACSRRGIYIDGAAVAAERVRAFAAKQDAAAGVDRIVQQSGFDMSLRFGKLLKSGVMRTPEFNPGSNYHVAAVLKHLGFPLPTTKTGQASTDKETLSRIEHPFVDALEAYRAATKRLSTYVEPYAKIAESADGRAHPHYSAWTRTGRTSATDPPVQVLDTDIKGFYSAPPGKAFLTADYQGIEFRIAAWIAGEQTILENYRRNQNWDPHLWFASRLYGVPEPEVLPNQRYLAKSANFSQLYMGDGYTLRAYLAREMNLFISQRESDRAHQAWHAAFPRFFSWYAWTAEQLREKGYIESKTGRRRHFGDVAMLNHWGFKEVLREAVNFQVQSFSTADFSLLGLWFCYAAKLPVNYFCHDSVGFEIDAADDGPDLREQIERCMIDQPLAMLRDRFGVDVTVPLAITFESHALQAAA